MRQSGLPAREVEAEAVVVGEERTRLGAEEESGWSDAAADGDVESCDVDAAVAVGDGAGVGLCSALSSFCAQAMISRAASLSM